MLDCGGCFANGVKGTNGLRLAGARLRVLRGVKPAVLAISICLRCSLPTCSNRGGSWKSGISFFVISSTSPSGVHRAVHGCVGATGRCCYGCHGFGQACSGRPGSFSLTRYRGGIEPGFGPIGAGNLALGQGGPELAVSCANSSNG
jgi:hypothetical protein